MGASAPSRKMHCERGVGGYKDNSQTTVEVGVVAGRGVILVRMRLG